MINGVPLRKLLRAVDSACEYFDVTKSPGQRSVKYFGASLHLGPSDCVVVYAELEENGFVADAYAVSLTELARGVDTTDELCNAVKHRFSEWINQFISNRASKAGD